ncbi:glycoside hydrolase domain-containing protein [candidate division KSB1 bacterium]
MKYLTFLKACIYMFFVIVLIFSINKCSSDQGTVMYGTGTWDGDSLGNHRAVLNVSDDSEAVSAHIEWRRRDKNPDKIETIITSAATGERVKNICRVNIKREYADIVFQPAAGTGEYYIYYMPYEIKGRGNYPTVIYKEPEETADEEWLKKNNLRTGNASDINLEKFPLAKLVEIQSVDEFNSFYPMEVIAAEAEVNDLISKHTEKSYILFPEDRKHPIRMTDDLPQKWILDGVTNDFKGEASPGEYYTFQIGLFAHAASINDVDVIFHELIGNNGSTVIPLSDFTCFNTEGINWDGEKFEKILPVEKEKVQALWCGVQIPPDMLPGRYESKVTVAPEGLEEQSINLILNIKGEIIEDSGDNEPWRHSRMRWFNSRIVFNDNIVAPFIPVNLTGNTISCLGRNVRINKSGFPESIKSFFAPEVTHISEESREILSSPIQILIENPQRGILKWRNEGVKFIEFTPGRVSWESKSTAGNLKMEIQANMEFDGFLEYKVKITTSKSTALNDMRLEIPVKKDAAKYMMGLGLKGGFRPEEHKWKWEVKHNQEGAWIGDVNAGLQFALRGANYSRPLNTNFYLSKPLNMPKSWYNDGKGGCDLFEKDENTFLVKCYSGEREIQSGEELYFNFNLMITPFKPVDTENHWNTRFYHSFKPVEEIAETGANTINVHHANNANPYINYPFINVKEMKEYIDEAHSKGLKVKIYNTIRELSNRAAELFAIRSLGDEIFSGGPGGGYSWLQEHIGSDYIAAWFVPHLKDAAIINSGMSRWHNYYVEGLDWLVKNVEIDGLYIDDVAFNRTTMKRVRKILDRREGALIDLHSANQFNVRDGFINSALLYMEHFPYINRLWFGEYFDYNSKPDFWLVEVSGIPFGLMGEMLQGGGNKWRGMIYGMTARLPWAGDPRGIWKVWDDFGIDESKMTGYWSSNCPVRTDRPLVKATAYVKSGKTLVSIASWAEEDVSVRLNIDWISLGIDPDNAVIEAPAIKDFQNSAQFKPGERIPVPQGKGRLLIISER